MRGRDLDKVGDVRGRDLDKAGDVRRSRHSQ